MRERERSKIKDLSRGLLMPGLSAIKQRLFERLTSIPDYFNVFSIKILKILIVLTTNIEIIRSDGTTYC